MASIANTLGSIDGNLKRNYAPKIVKLVPMLCLLQQYNPDETDQAKLPAIKVRWSEVAFNGQSFQYPTKVQSGQGVSYNGSDGTARTLEDALNMKIVQASIIGYEMVNRQQMTYSAAFAGDEAGTKAIEVNAKLMLEDLKDVLYSRNEMTALNGQNGDTGYGQVESQTISLTTMTLVFTKASFSAGWWPGQIGARVEFFNGTAFVPTGNQGTAYATVSSVDIATRTVVFTITGSGWSSGSVPAANNICFMKGALTTGGVYNEGIGLYKQLSAVSGTLFGLDRAQYGLLQGNVISNGNKRLTKALVTQYAMTPLNKGNVGLDLVLICSTSTWADLAAEDLSQRIFDSSYSGQISKSGSRQISYEVLNRTVRVVCHPYMQGGTAFLTSEEHMSWVGSTDVTFRLPTGENLFRLVDNTNAYESQAVSIKQLYHEAPGKAAVITGITNTT